MGAVLTKYRGEYVLKIAISVFLAAALCSFLVAGADSSTHNRLTAKERADGWKLLFDGKSMTNWIDPAAANPPGDAWSIEDGCLKAKPNPRITEDLVSTEKYRDFELQWDWKVSLNGNSGVKYRIQKFVVLTEATKKESGAKKFEDLVNYGISHSAEGDRTKVGNSGKAQIYVIGFEYQMIDDAGDTDAKNGGLYKTGAFYGIQGPLRPAARPVGEFNHSRLVVRGKHVEHWLNGVKVVDSTFDGDRFRDAVAKRWGKDSAAYHLMVDQPAEQCPFSLQNHDHATWFRDIKIKRL
jgi:hypothetical protein